MAPVVEYPGSRPYSIAQPERAYDERAYRIVTLSVGDRWDPPRRERRFPELVCRWGCRMTSTVAPGRTIPAAQVTAQRARSRCPSTRGCAQADLHALKIPYGTTGYELKRMRTARCRSLVCNRSDRAPATTR